MTTNAITRRPVHAAVLGGLALTAMGAALLVPSVLADDDAPDEVVADRPPATADPAPPAQPATDRGPTADDPAPATPVPDDGATADDPPAAPASDLADGRHLGRLTAADVAPDELVVDVLQLFTGADAVAAAEEDGVPPDEVHDFYLRNASTRLRSLPVSPTVTVTLVACGDAGCVEGAAGDYGALTRSLEGDTSPVWWLTLEDGAVVRIDEMYLP